MYKILLGGVVFAMIVTLILATALTYATRRIPREVCPYKFTKDDNINVTQ